MLGVALLIGFRPDASPLEWLAAVGRARADRVRAHLAVASRSAWSAKSVETASNLPMFLVLLPFLGSGFVPTDSMPAGLRWFAEHQPFTPIIETLRGLLARHARSARSAVIAVAWCVAIALVGYLWARRLYNRRSVQ